MFANRVANDIHAGAADLVDAWFASWIISDSAERLRSLSEITAAGIRFRDRYACIDGREELNDHIGASLRFMQGNRLVCLGVVCLCLFFLFVDSVANGPDGAERMSGVSVIALDVQGKIVSVTGFQN